MMDEFEDNAVEDDSISVMEEIVEVAIPSTPSLAFETRERFANWFIAEGDVDFQYKMI